MNRLGSSFASTGLSANFWTGLGLAVAFTAGISFASPEFSGIEPYYASLAGGILLLISGFFDVVDGTVARFTKQASKKGAFLDSTFDKIAELTVFAGLAIGNLANPFWCILALGLSLLVSYTRARAESLGVQLKGVGIGERAERLLVIAVSAIIPMGLDASSHLTSIVFWGVIAVAVLAAITLGQRIYSTSKSLST